MNKQISVCVSLLAVSIRLFLLLRFFRGGAVACVFGASEMICLAFTVRGLFRGVVSGSASGLLTPICYLFPSFLSVHGGSPFPLVLAAGAVCVAASGVQLALRAVLGRCVSVGVPVYSGRVIASGAYGHVRHPLAAVEFVAVLSFVVGHCSLYNAAVGVLALAGCVVAVLLEENFLRRFPSYEAYASRVVYRFVPGLI